MITEVESVDRDDLPCLRTPQLRLTSSCLITAQRGAAQKIISRDIPRVGEAARAAEREPVQLYLCTLRLRG